MKFILLLLTPLSILISCNTDKKRYQTIEEISIKSLQKSNLALSQLSSENYRILRENLREENHGEHAALWNNKAMKIKKLTSDLLTEIDRLDSKSKFSVDTLLLLKGKYITDIRLIDSSLLQVFKSEIDSFLINYGLTISPLFNNEKAKNDLLILESRFTSYIKNKFGMIIEDYTHFSALIGQNFSHLRSGQTLEITAGIGSYTISATPTFIINGEKVTPTEEGIAFYKLRVYGQGQKSIPVKIMFVGSDGQKKSKDFMIEYFVEK